MSMHKIPLTPLEEEGLRLHGLPIGIPSQRSDTFRQGVAWAVGEAKRLTEENERLRKDAERYRFIKSIAHSESAYESYQGNRMWFAVYDTERKGFDAAVDNAAINAARGAK